MRVLAGSLRHSQLTISGLFFEGHIVDVKGLALGTACISLDAEPKGKAAQREL